jgi:hypothetical protein
MIKTSMYRRLQIVTTSHFVQGCTYAVASQNRLGGKIIKNVS